MSLRVEGKAPQSPSEPGRCRRRSGPRLPHPWPLKLGFRTQAGAGVQGSSDLRGQAVWLLVCTCEKGRLLKAVQRMWEALQAPDQQ